MITDRTALATIKTLRMLFEAHLKAHENLVLIHEKFGSLSSRKAAAHLDAIEISRRSLDDVTKLLSLPPLEPQDHV